MIKVMYFASLREQLNQESEQIELPDEVQTVGDLRKNLAKRGAHWASAFDDQALVMMSVNHTMSNNDTAISDGDEIAFFPPVTGG